MAGISSTHGGKLSVTRGWTLAECGRVYPYGSQCPPYLVVFLVFRSKAIIVRTTNQNKTSHTSLCPSPEILCNIYVIIQRATRNLFL